MHLRAQECPGPRNKKQVSKKQMDRSYSDAQRKMDRSYSNGKRKMDRSYSDVKRQRRIEVIQTSEKDG